MYKRIAEELKKDANFWDRHSTLINEAYESATASEKRLIDDAMQATRKDRMLTELSVRLLNGDDELYVVKPRTIIGSQQMVQQAREILKKELEQSWRESKAELAGIKQEMLNRGI